MYICRNGSVFNWGKARALLGANAPDAIWGDASRNEADNTYRVNGTTDGVETYYARLTEDGKMLVIWTKEDDETGRTTAKPDAPPLLSVMGSNEKNPGEIVAEQVSSPESESAPKASQLDVQTSATLSPPELRPDSVRVIHTKIRHIRLWTSMPHRHVDAETRLIALWHQSLRHAKSQGVKRLSHSNKGQRRKSDTPPRSAIDAVLGRKAAQRTTHQKSRAGGSNPGASFVPNSCLYGLRRASAATHRYHTGGHDREWYEHHDYPRRGSVVSRRRTRTARIP
ncbi:MAG: hypothetical protein QOI53_2029 [Verrucomicrobiota bacterium]|nr:hypothetical protein [Verrucomicrobiota bacterium]